MKLGFRPLRKAITVALATNHPLVDTQEQVHTEDEWVTLIDDIRLDDDPTEYTSVSQDTDGLSALWVNIEVESTNAPTDVRLLAQFSYNDVAWGDFEEGLWASLYYEDQDTAAGISDYFLLPCGGIDHVRFRVTASGTDATNYFDVTVRVRGFWGNFETAHS